MQSYKESCEKPHETLITSIAFTYLHATILLIIWSHSQSKRLFFHIKKTVFWIWDSSIDSNLIVSSGNYINGNNNILQNDWIEIPLVWSIFKLSIPNLQHESCLFKHDIDCNLSILHKFRSTAKSYNIYRCVNKKMFWIFPLRIFYWRVSIKARCYFYWIFSLVLLLYFWFYSQMISIWLIIMNYIFILNWKNVLGIYFKLCNLPTKNTHVYFHIDNPIGELSTHMAADCTSNIYF